MALLNPTFLLGLFVLLYLSSFVIFAVIRILTGVSIQRIGYLSLRRLAYTPRDGFTVEIRGLGINVHRPTFAQPTWISLVLSELVVTIDIGEMQGRRRTGYQDEAAREDELSAESVPLHKNRSAHSHAQAASRTDIWKQIAKFKERAQRLHRNIKWLRMVDLVATNSTISVVGVGNVQVGSFTIAVDTRRKMVDRARFSFQKSQSQRRDHRQAEWIVTLRSLLFTADGNESLEVLDHALLTIHGFLYESKDGLREATVALKLGRVHVPYDDIQLCAAKLERYRRASATSDSEEALDISMSPAVPKSDGSGGQSAELIKTVSDSRQFFSSILRGVKEVQFAVSFVGLTKKVSSVKPASNPILLNASMKEVGFDLHRLDSKSPAHRMYFSSKDIAHEALAAALSISLGIDDGHGKLERLVYIPMATTTVRTTLPSKTVQLAQDGIIDEKNANIMFANSVVTSPSVDLDPRHLPLLIALMQPEPAPPKTRRERNYGLISRLLPKANMKLSMHEPVVRIKLKPLQDTQDPDDFDLIISSISSVSLDVESSHSSVEDLQYFLDGAMRLQSHRLYYQTCSGEIFNLMTTESLDLRIHLGANPDVCVDVTSNIQSFSISMVRQEISDGLRQIVRQLRIDVEPEKRATSKTVRRPNFIRSVPDWLIRYHFEAADFNVEVAGVDEDISDDTRGVSLHLDSFSAEYRAHKFDGPQRQPTRRRTHSRSINQSDSDLAPTPTSPRFRRKPQNTGDGRRLALHARGMEAQIVEAADRLEAEPFVSVPRLELVFSASSDGQGPVFHMQSSVRTVMIQYSLYRHYAMGVAVMTLRRAFLRTGRDAPRPRQQSTYLSPDQISTSPGASETMSASTVTPELFTADIKAALVQVKAEMPHEPLMMLHVYGLEAGRHRWSTPYLSSKLVRLYVEPPRTRNVWARIVSVKNGRIDWRESRHKLALGGYAEEKMIDIATEAVRVAIPHEVIVNRITDNITNVIKAVQQLHHRFKTGTNEYILEKRPQGPKKVPKISFRSRALLLELEDGAFEWKLGIIYRTGRVEQMQRLARQEAFRVKSKRVREEAARRGSKARSKSARPRGRADQASSSWFRSRSLDSYQQDVHGFSRGTMPRYDPDGESLGINGHAKVSEDEARAHLNLFDAQSWKKRIDRAYKASQASMRELRGMFWGLSQTPEDVEVTENILEVPQRPALMSTMISDFHLTIDKPTFAIRDLPAFIHKVGKGMPLDTKYSLLVPMHVSIGMGEARLNLRDYPLPLLHIPALKTGQSSRVQSISLKANFVIGEEFRGVESTRRVRVNVIPPQHAAAASSGDGSFAIDVRRTIGPIKSFSDVYMDINTALPTRITWGPCYQPAVQDMMMVVESFTKPQVDPSERAGFWDKLRLNTHSRIHLAWKGDGDMHLSLKGTRDPYRVTGNGAGFLMCWRSDVRWNINAEDDPKRFITVDSGEYILAIPDYSHLVREAARRREVDEGPLTEDSVKEGAQFKKVVMKLSGNVQWMTGIMFERAIEDGKRSFDFKPHYDVVLKNAMYAKSEDGLPYDALRGFRSRHIHLSIAVRAPADRDWMSQDPEPSRSYNSVHLTPRFFTHFFEWWGLFSHPMSLPIRQGPLFPGRERNSRKLGRHMATIKYSLLLAPLFLSHIYKHKDAEDHSEHAVSATGLKVRFDSFMLDLHQRREEFNTLGKGKNASNRTSGIKLHAAQLDLVSADVRAVSASLKGTTTEAIKKGSITTLIAEQDEKPDLSKFTIPDNDFSWIDMDDFVELDWILPTEPHPETQILPLAFAPRLTYFGQTDIGGTIAGDPMRTSPFGNEPTHSCIMTHDDDPKRVQGQLIQERLDQLEVQMLTHSRNVGEAELKAVQTDSQDPEIMADLDALRKHTGVLKEKKASLENMLEQMKAPTSATGNGGTGKRQWAWPAEGDGVLDIPSATEFESDFKNRFVVHNMQLKWNNLLRNIVLRYIHQNSQRRGFIYYLSRPAVKFILDIVEEQNKAKSSKPAKAASVAGTASPSLSGAERDSIHDLEDRIKNILGDRRRGTTGASFAANGDGTCASIEDLESGISKEFSPQRGYHVRLIAPQIQLQSDKNKKHVVLVTAKGMELKVLEVMDKKRISDTVSGLVQRRFLVNMDSTQFFVTHQKWFLTNLVSLYAGSRYGAPRGSSWPPWVPMEVMFNFTADPFGFKRVVQKTSAMLRYDKYNNLRLKYNDEINTDEVAGLTSPESTESRADNLWVEFPQARALCNSSQYYAMYVMVLDLLMYSEPLEKTRSERLEKIMLASDFSDLSGAPKMVQRLQERIKQLEDIKHHFQMYSKYLDKRAWEDRLSLERDLAACEDELFFMMKAITTSQRKYDIDSDTNALLKWSITAREIVWHLIQDSNEPLVELQLKDVEYDRTDNSDGSHMNLIRVGKVLGLNLLPDATYPEIIAPYYGDERASSAQATGQQQPQQDKDMIRVYWHMLEAIAGIPVMDRFDVNLFPVKVQLEREAGKRLFDYIFPGMDGDNKVASARNHSPYIIKQDMSGLEDEDSESLASSNSRLGTPPVGDGEPAGFSTRAGSLELRLRPTLSSNAVQERSPKKALSVNSGEGHGFRLFRSSGTGRTMLSKKASHDSLRPSATPRPGSNIGRTSTGLSSRDGRETDGKKGTRFGLRGKGQADDKQQPQSDDLSKMITRASNYMTFAYIRVPSVVLCLSYKGKDQRNFEDVHDFVFRLPTMEWQNKTWSNLDLALALKKAVVKALISHTGAIIGNKISKHRPNAEQRSKLRELASSSVLISAMQSYAGSVNDSDDSSSMYGTSPVDYSRSPPQSTRGSTHSSIPAPPSSSRSSSVASGQSRRMGGGGVAGNVPTFLTMTPPTPVEGRTESQGLALDLLRPSTSSSPGVSRRSLRSAGVTDSRPSTSAGNLETGDRRRTTGGGLRDKLNALTHRKSHREDHSGNGSNGQGGGREGGGVGGGGGGGGGAAGR
ncbi:hypothetical protein G6O67_006423 [Ophiocordyceps sinensis]|uniref:Fmp27-like protein n=1 Tax=Ophiocordyceps sinensis TaxID=72228 RepID=A0A8H4LW49_9HYPO|nr:hypothetical protein G6O67_006423 [Ophiocordyceps sinensis]